MTNDNQARINELKTLKLKGKSSSSPRVAELQNNADVAFGFCVDYFNKPNRSLSIAFSEMLSFITKNDFEKLIKMAIEKLEQTPKYEPAEEIIAYASLQFAELLHPYLERLLTLRPNESAYYGSYFCINLPLEKTHGLLTQLSKETVKEKQEFYFECILQTRHISVIAQAVDFIIDKKIIEQDKIKWWLEMVGLTLQNGEIMTYCPNPTYHLIFDKNYLNKTWFGKFINQPTWHLPIDNPQPYNFGGVLNDDDYFAKLIELNPMPQGFNITELDSLTLACHLDEMSAGWGTLYYQHDKNGMPSKIGELKPAEFEPQSFTPTQVYLAPTPKRWQLQDWALSNSRENLFRIGGEPSWIQSAECMSCPKCQQKMNFLMQLDTIDSEDESLNTIYFGSGGILYIFWCNDCKVSGYEMQCT